MIDRRGRISRNACCCGQRRRGRLDFGCNEPPAQDRNLAVAQLLLGRHVRLRISREHPNDFAFFLIARYDDRPLGTPLADSGCRIEPQVGVLLQRPMAFDAMPIQNRLHRDRHSRYLGCAGTARHKLDQTADSEP